MKEEVLYMKIQTALKDKLRESAKKNHRSVTGQALYLIEQGLTVLESEEARAE